MRFSLRLLEFPLDQLAHRGGFPHVARHFSRRFIVGQINNIFAYDTTNKSLLTQTALSQAGTVQLSELRSMVLANGYLYVANGGKSISDVLCYLPPITGSSFTYLSTVISAMLNNKNDFEKSIAHPFGIAFNGSELCYVSNQDTNVVAQVTLTSNSRSGSIGSGCQSAYLSQLFPPPASFLDGTYVASQNGSLHGVDVTAPNVLASQGGPGVTLDGSSVQNSVRDDAIANGILFVCDEPDSVVNMYSLTDGTFIGSSNTLSGKPTHLAMQNGGLYVSAGSLLCWGQLPSSVQGASLSLQNIALTTPNGETIGGISFDNGTPAATVYIPFQAGTGGANGGSIYTYTVTQSSPSTLPLWSNGTEFVASGSSTFQDTPEFAFYMPD